MSEPVPPRRRPAGVSRSQAAITIIALLAVVLVAALVRCASYRDVRADGQWVLADGDSYYHLRRIEETIKRGGRVPMFDPWLDYPHGQRIQWHGGYDLVVAGAVVAVCGARPSRACLTTAAAATTPILGVLATILVVILGWSVGGRGVGTLAGFLFATYPFSAGAGALGHVDHHVMEGLVLAAWLLLLVRGRTISAGLVTGAALAVFPSALLPAVATTAALTAVRFASLRNAAADWRPTIYTAAAAVAAVPVVFTGGFHDRWEVSATSLLHLAVLAVAAAALAASEVAIRRWPARRLLAGSIPIVMAVVAAAGTGWRQVSTLTVFGQASGLWSGVIQQVPYGWAMGLVFGTMGVIVTASALRRGHWDRAVVAVVALPLTGAGILMIRYLPLASAALSVVVALFLLEGARWLRARLASEGRRARVLAGTVVVGCYALALVPLTEYLVRRPPVFPRFFLSGIHVLERLKERPPGAVLSDWTWGHHILWFANRPTVASPFILSGRDDGNVVARRALLSTSFDELRAAMHRRRARYVLVSGLFDVALAARSLGQPAPSRPVVSRLLAGRVDGAPWLHLVDRDQRVLLYALVR